MCYSLAVRKRARELREGGMSLDKIVAQLNGVSRSTVFRWITPGAMEMAASYSRRYVEAHQEKIKKYREDTKRQKAERRKDRYRENPEVELLKCAEYRKNNPQKLRETQANYRKTHVKERIEYGRTRRAKVGYDSKIKDSEYKKLLLKQDGRCFYCGKKMLIRGDYHDPDHCNVEHVNPISNGGFHRLDNIVLSCHKCNMSKGNKLVEAWMPSILAKISATDGLKYNIKEASMRWLI
jgi:5-methylcytosine-specific restriction endonuclease McrA